jgi:two-component system CitB family sensor kinase
VIDADTTRPETARPTRRGARFATQLLVLQLVVVIVVVGLTSAVFFRIAVHRLETGAESTALAIAQSVASDTDLRSEVARLSVDGTDLDRAALADGPVQAGALDTARRTGALFVVVTDDNGIRLAHPDVDRIGELVSTSAAAALRGEETVSWDRGTLGESARAKVPIYASGAGANSKPVGEVSVGFARARVYDSLMRDAIPVFGVGLLALLIGIVASILIRRRLVRLTLGLQPEDLVSLVQNQQAVLGGFGEGVFAVSPTGVVTVCNERAAALLGIQDPTGHPIEEASLPGEFRRILGSPSFEGDSTLVVGAHVLLVDVRRVARDGHDLGVVAVVRDRTDVEALSRRLDAVGAMTTALRAQRHEFANRLHAVSGLLEIGQVEQARGYLADVLERGPLRYPVKHADRLTEPYLQAFLGAKGVEAAERGVLLQLGAETLVAGVVAEPGDVTTVLGNLIDNAVAAAVAGDVSPAWVEIEVLDDGSDLHLSVMDSGRGFRPSAASADPFERRPGPTDTPPQPGAKDPAHGLGFGLPLSRELARRSGGDVWLASAGGDDHGAIFCARLVAVMTPGGLS